jgi:hypothetical protein
MNTLKKWGTAPLTSMQSKKLKHSLVILFFSMLAIMVYCIISRSINVHMEKEYCKNGAISGLCQIRLSMLEYYELNKNLPSEIKLISRADDAKFLETPVNNNLSFFSSTETKWLPFLYHKPSNIHDNDLGKILVAAPSPISGHRFVLLLEDIVCYKADVGKKLWDYVIKIPEKEFQEQAKRQGWKVEQ